MYIYVTKEETRPFRYYCQEVLNELQKKLRETHSIVVQSSLAGSGARNMVTRNGEGPFDLDFNLMILSAPREYEESPQKLKEVIRRTLDDLIRKKCSYGKESTSSIKYIIHSVDGKKVEIYFDVAVLRRDEESGDILRLIHDKKNEVTYWNQKPDEKNLDFYELVIKKAGCWKAVRDLYLEKKNMYQKFP